MAVRLLVCDHRVNCSKALLLQPPSQGAAAAAIADLRSASPHALMYVVGDISRASVHLDASNL